MLTEARRSALKRSALRWIRIVERLVGRLSLGGLPAQLHQLASGQRTADEWIIDAHLLAVALRQVEQHLKHLDRYETEPLARAAQEYLAEYQSLEIKNLRDVLEHEAEYTADAKTAKLPQAEYVRDLAAPISFGSTSGRARLRLRLRPRV